jgi:hypothetical protein
MEMEILRKKLSTYRTAKGRITKVPDEIAMEILQSWEQWTGSSSGFYSALGADYRKMASILGKAKKLKREGGMVAPSEFTELTPEGLGIASPMTPSGGGIELSIDGASVIRFPRVDDLIEFLRKAA